MGLDIIYTLMLDEVPLESRHGYRTALDDELTRPLDPDARAEQEREKWGLKPEQIAEAEAGEAMLAQWGGE